MPFAPKQCATTRKRLRVMGVQLQIFDASSSRDIDAAFAALARERADALFVGPDAFFNTWRVQLANPAAHYSMPAAFAVRGYVDAGGLMSYGTASQTCIGRSVFIPARARSPPIYRCCNPLSCNCSSMHRRQECFASPRPHRCSALLTSRSKSLLFTEVSRIRRSCEVVAARDL
jgi:hypothetical protein